MRGRNSLESKGLAPWHAAHFASQTNFRLPGSRVNSWSTGRRSRPLALEPVEAPPVGHTRSQGRRIVNVDTPANKTPQPTPPFCRLGHSCAPGPPRSLRIAIAEALTDPARGTSRLPGLRSGPEAVPVESREQAVSSNSCPAVAAPGTREPAVPGGAGADANRAASRSSRCRRRGRGLDHHDLFARGYFFSSALRCARSIAMSFFSPWIACRSW